MKDEKKNDPKSEEDSKKGNSDKDKKQPKQEKLVSKIIFI